MEWKKGCQLLKEFISINSSRPTYCISYLYHLAQPHWFKFHLIQFYLYTAKPQQKRQMVTLEYTVCWSADIHWPPKPFIFLKPLWCGTSGQRDIQTPFRDLYLWQPALYRQRQSQSFAEASTHNVPDAVAQWQTLMYSFCWGDLALCTEEAHSLWCLLMILAANFAVWVAAEPHNTTTQ